MTDFIKPTSNTDATNKELIRKTTPQGDLISDGTNPRILSGFQKTGFGDKDFGFKVSQEGYDVETATDDQLVMSSAFNMFKIVESGVVTITTPATWPYGSNNPLIATIPHGQSIVPSFQVYVTTPVTGVGFFAEGILTQLPLNLVLKDTDPTYGLGSKVVIQSYAAVDETNLYIYLVNTYGVNVVLDNNNWDYRYYILKETASS